MRAILLLFLLGSFSISWGQTIVVPFADIQQKSNSSLTETFYEQLQYQIPTDTLVQSLREQPDRAVVPMELHFREEVIVLELERFYMTGPNFRVRVAYDHGIEEVPHAEPLTYRGQVRGGGAVRLTITEDFVYGFWEVKGEKFFIEPLRMFLPEAMTNEVIIYREKNAKPQSGLMCAVDHSAHRQRQLDPVVRNADKAGQCYEIEIALAGDGQMAQVFGVSGTVGFMFGVLSNVQTNYDDEFADQILFLGGETFVSSSPGNDPWTSSSSASALLNSFANWGNGGGFGNSDHDVATLWTDRNLNGSTIGIAFLSAVCFADRYNVCERFTGSSNFLRNLQAHELGHNFSARHDASGSPFIMAPSVNGSNLWSIDSRDDIEGFVNSISCPESCGSSGVPPTADFTLDVPMGCAPHTVLFDDVSTGQVESRMWFFPGGMPSTSTDPFPAVTYTQPGTYSVTLEVSNANGTSTETRADIIIVDTQPEVSFTASLAPTGGLEYIFEGTADHADSWEYDFDDGSFSTDLFTLHEFALSGDYLVTLTAVNSCGVDEFTQLITVESPLTADFAANVTDGCAPLTVQFTDNTAGIVQNWNWQFPGGTPDQSILDNPEVVYTQPGIYPVTLTVSAGNSSDVITRTDYITVTGGPTAGFDADPIPGGGQVAFSYTGSDADRHSWDFGDGAGSSEASPLHTYTDEGAYTVQQIVENDCGADTLEQQITIVLPPQAGFSASMQAGCAPFDVQYSTQAQGAGISYAWTFEGGDPATSTTAQPSVHYQQPGIYTVGLTVTNAAGSSVAEEVDYITVGAGPVADFSVDAPLGQLTVDFVEQSQGANSFSWDFGDGTTSEQPSPSHTYATEGTYTVRLITENACDSDTSVQDITLLLPPQASFTTNQQMGCMPATVMYYAQPVGTGLTYAWQFEGGTPATSTTDSPSVIYAAAGTYDVQLTVTNAAGASTVEEMDYIVIGAGPTADFVADAPAGQLEASFSNQSHQADRYQWDFGDGSASTLADPHHTYSAEGTYTVQLIATNGCGADTTIQTIELILPPDAIFTSSGRTGCAPYSVFFAAVEQDSGNTYAWQFDGGDPLTSDEATPTVVYTTAGTYAVRLTVTNAAGSNTTEQLSYITVESGPEADFVTNAPLGQLQVDFDNLSQEATDYRWDFGDGNASTSAAPTHIYANPGTYTVQLIAENDCGSDTTEQMIILLLPPTATFTAAQQTGCAPLEVNFAAAVQAPNQTYNWSFEGGTPLVSTDAEPTVQYTLPGIYSVQLTVTNAAGTDTRQQTNYITVTGDPEADFVFTQNVRSVAFQSQAVDADSYLWQFGDGQLSTAQNPSHTYTAPGTYQVVHIAINSCGRDTMTREVVVDPDLPMVNFSLSQSSGCVPFNVTYTSMTQGADSLSWEFEGGTPATSQDSVVTVVYTQAGTYATTLYASNVVGTVSNSNFTAVQAVGQPSAGFNYTTDAATLDFVSTATGADTVAWDFAGLDRATGMEVRYTFPGAGVYEITQIVSNTCGSDTAVQTIEITGLPPIAGITYDASPCVPAEVVFVSTATDATQNSWAFDGGMAITVTDDSLRISYEEPGSYTVTLISTNAFGSDTAVVTLNDLQMLPDPVVAVDQQGDVVAFSATEHSGTTYSWDFGDGQTGSGVMVQHLYETQGSFTVTLYATNACGTDTLVLDMAIVISSIQTPDWAETLQLFPNPSQGQVQLRILGARTQALRWRLLSIEGKNLGQGTLALSAGQLQYSFDWKGLPAGTYILQLQAEGQEPFYRRLLLQR